VKVAFTVGDAAPAFGWAGKTLRLDDAMKAATPVTGIPQATSNDLATIIYTSGSTGRAKGIMLTHQNVVAGAQIVSTYLENTPDDRVLCVLPFNFDAGLNQFTTMLRVGGTAALQRSLLPGEILKSLRQHRITGLAGVPPLWAVLMPLRRSLQREPLEHLRYISNTGGMIPSAHLQNLRDMLGSTKIFLMYGLTEAFRSTFLPPSEIDRGSSCIGKAIPNTDVWVVRPDGTETDPDEPGELIHRGPTVALGYWGDEEKTAAVYKPNPFAPEGTLKRDMVVYSGDIVTRDKDGYMYFIGRRDEQIKTEGYRVSPQEIEDLLCSMPAVHQAAAFGKKDGALGHRVVAVLSLNAGEKATVEEIKQFCAGKAPHYMVPKEITILPDLPRTSSGKLDRSSLKREYAAD
jgi:acyl-CoA synthetase (AMP-forming)/AMP-acid ligase II